MRVLQYMVFDGVLLSRKYNVVEPLRVPIDTGYP